MKRIKETLPVGLLVVALATLTAAPAAASDHVERPHKGTDVGTVVLQPIENCDATGFPVFVCEFTTTGTGNHTHLGKVATSSTGLATFNIFAPPCELLDGSNIGLVVENAGTFVFVAANGDEVSGTFENTVCAGPPGSGLAGGLAGTQTITGGTGRFEGATGNVDTIGTGVDDTFNLTFNGAIEY